jgi:hypothetical protein
MRRTSAEASRNGPGQELLRTVPSTQAPLAYFGSRDRDVIRYASRYYLILRYTSLSCGMLNMKIKFVDCLVVYTINYVNTLPQVNCCSSCRSFRSSQCWLTNPQAVALPPDDLAHFDDQTSRADVVTSSHHCLLRPV